MGTGSPSNSLLKLARSYRRLEILDPVTQCLAPSLCRTLATVSDLPHRYPSPSDLRNVLTPTHPPTLTPVVNWSSPPVTTTVYSWPVLEPLRYATYPTAYLSVPLRRDILHRAVIYEGDMSRQGTASTKWRGDVQGSSKKLHAQKGTGKARVGDKKSPIRRGGGVAHGPHPRDFSTGLQRKVYDLAWRTALSYRFKKGELVVIDGYMGLERKAGPRWLWNVFQENGWYKNQGNSTLVTTGNLRGESHEVKSERRSLKRVMEEVGFGGLLKDSEDVDVKDLLGGGRIVIEKAALDSLLAGHASDLTPAERSWKQEEASIYA